MRDYREWQTCFNDSGQLNSVPECVPNLNEQEQAHDSLTRPPQDIEQGCIIDVLIVVKDSQIMLLIVAFQILCRRA